MRIQSPFRWLRALFTLCALFPGVGLAIAPHIDCRAPFVFADADINVVVLPYRAVGTISAPINQLGQRLALLVKLDVFSHILSYGSIGAVQMEIPKGITDDGRCGPDVVIPQLLGRITGAENQVAKGNGVIFVWGIIYEEDEDIIVQSYVRFMRRDTSETIVLKAGEYQFFGKPSDGNIAFSPQLFRKDRLKAVEKSYAKADFVRQEPRDDAPGEPLPHPVAKCFGCGDMVPNGFQVEESKGEWIHVRWVKPQSHATRAGWIHAAGGLAGESLDRVLPELSFIQGTVGYLRQRIADSRGEPLSVALTDQTLQDFTSFETASALLPGSGAAAAVAEQLSGIVGVLHGGVDALTRAGRHFDVAIKLAPYDANGITLEAITQIASAWEQRHTVDNTDFLATRLTAAATLSDDPSTAIDNLRSFYKLLQTIPAIVTSPTLPSSVISARIQQLDRIRTSAQ